MHVADSGLDDFPRAGHLRLGEHSATRGRILVVDDDEVSLRALERVLRIEGFATATAADGEEALAEVNRAPPDIVLTDLYMEPMGGVELLGHIHELDPNLPVIVMTGQSDVSSAIESLRGRAEDYLTKPLQVDSVLWSIDRAIVRRRAKIEQEELQRTLNERLVLSSIQDQYHAETAARHAAQLEALLANLSEGVIIVDSQTRGLVVNEAGRAILGLPSGANAPTLRVSSLEAHDLEDRPLDRERHPCVRALRGEQFADYEVLRVRPNGERRRVVSTGTCVRDENGDVALAIVMFRDVTELRRLEQQRDEYLALVSHDLRNPLSAIKMSLARLKTSLSALRGADGALTGIMTLVERAERNTNRMVAMLQELREATSLEAQGTPLRKVDCDVRKLVVDVVDSVDDADARRISVEAEGASHYIVLGDVPRLERVVANLLTNALKYSGDRPVTVRLARVDGSVVLDVIDRGIGIAPENVNKLFERYYRTTVSKMRAEGLGLGLYIANLIVQMHGGRIDVASEVGKGSVFRLTLPALAA